jgi:hypothetical protein
MNERLAMNERLDFGVLLFFQSNTASDVYSLVYPHRFLIMGINVIPNRVGHYSEPDNSVFI